MKKQLLTKVLMGATLVIAGGNTAQAQNLNFSSNNQESLAVGQSHRTLPLFGDYNNDGIMDVYYSGRAYVNDEWFNPGSIVALNKGDKTFDIVKSDIYTSWGYGSKTIDFDQDGLVDILFITGEEGDVQDNFGLKLLHNEGEGKFTEIADECLAGLNLGGNNHRNNNGNPWQSLSIGDYNKDGYPDILIMGDAKDGSRVCKLLKNNEGKSFEVVFSLPMNHGTAWLADFTGDGWVDILVNGWSDEFAWCFMLYENNHDGTFSNISEQAFGSNTAYGFEGAGENTVQVLDYNQDGNLDIFLMGSLRQVGTSWSGKHAFLLKNNGNKTFSEVETNVMALSGATERYNFMADFNGDGYVDYIGKGWGADRGDWSWAISSSKGAMDQYDYNHDNPGIYDQEGMQSIGDWNNDGLLDLATSNWTEYASQIIFSENKAEGATAVKPTAPSEVKAEYDKDTKTVNVSWTAGTMINDSKPFYNLYLKNKETGKTFMVVPANAELGTQSGYAEFSNYVLPTRYTFENVEEGDYEVGVQSVTYSWQASTFETANVTKPDAIQTAVSETEKNVDVYTLSGVCVKSNVKKSEALNGLNKGVYVVDGTKVIK